MKKEYSQEEFNAEVKKIPAWVCESRSMKAHYFKVKAELLMYKALFDMMEDKIKLDHKNSNSELLNEATLILNKFYVLYANFEEDQEVFNRVEKKR